MSAGRLAARRAREGSRRNRSHCSRLACRGQAAVGESESAHFVKRRTHAPPSRVRRDPTSRRRPASFAETRGPQAPLTSQVSQLNQQLERRKCGHPSCDSARSPRRRDAATVAGAQRGASSGRRERRREEPPLAAHADPDSADKGAARDVAPRRCRRPSKVARADVPPAPTRLRALIKTPEVGRIDGRRRGFYGRRSAPEMDGADCCAAANCLLRNCFMSSSVD